jgi:hypothetical protein
LGPQFVGDAPPLQPGGLGVVLRERRADEGRRDAPIVLAGMHQGAAHKCIRQRCQVALSALLTAALMPL